MRALDQLAHEALARAGLATDTMSWIALDRHGSAGARVALLTFRKGEREPHAFIKLADPAADDTSPFACEAANLESLADLHNADVSARVPRCLHHGTVGGAHVLVQSACPGQRVKNLAPGRFMRSPRSRQCLGDALDFLAALHGAGKTPAVSLTADDAVAVVDEYRLGFNPSSALESLFEHSVAWMGANSVATVPCHGDFCTANLILSRSGQLRVFDWEYPLAGGWPLADLLYLLSSLWVTPSRRGEAARVRNYEQLFFAPNLRAAWVRELTLRHLQGLGLPACGGLPLVTLAWAGYANRKRRELGLSPGEALPPAASHFTPLTMLQEDSCLNLEILARRREELFLVSPPAPTGSTGPGTAIMADT